MGSRFRGLLDLGEFLEGGRDDGGEEAQKRPHQLPETTTRNPKPEPNEMKPNQAIASVRRFRVSAFLGGLHDTRSGEEDQETQHQLPATR